MMGGWGKKRPHFLIYVESGMCQLVNSWAEGKKGCLGPGMGSDGFSDP